MRRAHLRALLLGLLGMIILAESAMAQSGSRRRRFVRRTRPDANQAVASEYAKQARRLIPPRELLALDGHDPVVLYETGQLVAGREGLTSLFDFQVYRFANRESKSAFDARPGQYAAVLAGDSIVAFKDQQRRLPGKLEHYAKFGGRLYLFYDTDERDRFRENPSEFTDADLVLNGHSPVSLVDESVLRPGNGQHEETVEGCRVLLASAQEQDKFRSDPARYFPTLSGLDPVSIVKGEAAHGFAEFAIVFKNRLYAMSSLANRDTFLGNAELYSDLDVAANGICPVTLAETQKSMPGNYGISVIYLGQRVLFAGERQRQQFLEKPAKYREQMILASSN